MKKIFSVLYCCSIISASALAQSAFHTRDSVNINNINATVLVHGDMWWDSDTLSFKPKCYYPNGSQKNINFVGSIWLSAYDGSGQLHVAAQTYRQTGNDYWPGPLDNSDTLTYATSSDWAKIWKVNRLDIFTFLSLPTHTTTNTPQSILTWPGKVNAHAEGNGGAPLMITNEMAPFVDLNYNGIYEPLLGEYPDIKGDQALWWVFSDNGPTHNMTNAKPLGVEIHAMSYAYSRGTLIDNVVYYEYTMVNKSANNYTNMRAAQWDDIDLGYAFDDYIGFDSTWRMGICYSGTGCDGCSGGMPSNAYGFNPPQSAITMIVQPGDTGTSYKPAGSFIFYEFFVPNPTGIFNDTFYNNSMRAILSDGKPIASHFTSGTLPCGGYDSTSTTNYFYPGDPSDSNQWSECRCHLNPGDRRFVLASNDFTLNAGSSQKIVFAQLVADSTGGCPNTSFAKIRIVADTAWANYHHEAAAVSDIHLNSGINIYPNPAHDKLIIEPYRLNILDGSVIIYNILGQQVHVAITNSGNKQEADISKLPDGFYNVLYRNGSVQVTMKFIKH